MRKFFTLFLTFLALFIGIGTTAIAGNPATYSVGDGTPGNPYQITTAVQLDSIRKFLGDNAVNFKLMNDIDLTGYTWTPVGTWVGSPYKTIFLGTLDGNGHVIANLTITATSGDCGFFAGLNGPATIKNLGFTGTTTLSGLGTNSLGTIAGFANGGDASAVVTISNCYSTLTLTGKEKVGGLVGTGSPVVTLSYSTGSITGTGGFIGGIVGSFSGDISKCFSTGAITGGDLKVGGICGEMSNGKVNGCYSTGNITNTKSSGIRAGGIAGEIYNNAEVRNCYATGKIISGTNAGGIVGQNWNNSIISNCIALNFSIKATTDNNLIIGSANSNKLTFNYAFFGIVIDGRATTTSNSNDLTSVNGLITSKSDVLAHATYETSLGWDFVNTWEWTSAGLPTLKGLANQPTSLPANLMPSSISSIVVSGITTTVGLTSQMNAKVSPVYADNYSASVTWSVNDNSIATIDASGMLTGIKEGTVIVTATSTVDNTIKGTANIAVIKQITGAGTIGDPYKIFSAYDLLQVGNFLNNSSVVFELQNDIDMSIASPWTPIGGANVFSGTLDGHGFAIKNMVINSSNTNTGLFTSLVGPATIKNLGFIGENSSVNGTSCVGSIAGLVNIGPASAKVLITNCYSTINVVGIADKVGGLVGSGEVAISKCFTTGKVTTSSGTAGGIAGYLSNTGSITDCYSAGDVVNLPGGNWNMGGICGGIDNTTTVTNCYATGKVNGTVSAAGIVGTNWNANVTSNCIALNSGLNGTQEVNRIIASPKEGAIVNCYSNINIPVTGRVGTTKTDVGLSTVNGLGLTKKEVILPATYTDKLGWDMTNTWEFSSYGLPVLKGMINQPVSLPAHLVSYDVASISLTGNNSITTLLGAVQLTANILPANSDDLSVTWTVDNPLIATVSATGLVQSATNGVVVVTATSKMDNTKVATITITITNQIPITAVSVAGKDGATTISTLAGTLAMIVTTTPVVPDANTVTWSVDKPAVATIDATTGILSAVTNGVVEVTGTYIGNVAVFGKATITVSNQSPITAITIKGTANAKTIKTLGGTLAMLVATTTPAIPDDASITWSVDKPAIATIDAATGILTAVSNGIVIVSATSNVNAAVSGTASITVSNQSPITAITVKGTGDATTITTLAGTLTMLVVTTPTVPDVATITWSVDKPEIATINANGVLTAVTNGIVKVTATSTANTSISGSINITVSGQGTSVATMNAEVLSIYPNPVSDDLKVSGIALGTEVEIYNNAGILVKAIKFTGASINVSDLIKGVYFVKVNNIVTKLVKK